MSRRVDGAPEDLPVRIVESSASEQAEASPLEALLADEEARRRSRKDAPVCVMGECVDDRHPTLMGRVLVRFAEGGSSAERWFPTLQGLPVRKADRVLMMRPEGTNEWVVTGVVDGFAKRPQHERGSSAVLELRRDEAVRVVGADGRELIEIHEGESGPVLRLLHDDLELAVPGRVRIRGKQVQFEAEQGRVEIKATDDVVVRGEVIRLN